MATRLEKVSCDELLIRKLSAGEHPHAGKENSRLKIYENVEDCCEYNALNRGNFSKNEVSLVCLCGVTWN